jgi:hypothetical protein
MHWNFLQAKLYCRLVAGVADDNDTGLVHDDRLAEAEFADGGGDGVHASVIQTGITLVWPDTAKRTHFYVHVQLLLIGLRNRFEPELEGSSHRRLTTANQAAAE